MIGPPIDMDRWWREANAIAKVLDQWKEGTAMDLYTRDGSRIGTPTSQALAMMEYNGKPPEIVSWGERLFVREGDRYVEGMAWALQPDELQLG